MPLREGKSMSYVTACKAGLELVGIFYLAHPHWVSCRYTHLWVPPSSQAHCSSEFGTLSCVVVGDERPQQLKQPRTIAVNFSHPDGQVTFRINPDGVIGKLSWPTVCS